MFSFKRLSEANAMISPDALKIPAWLESPDGSIFRFPFISAPLAAFEVVVPASFILPPPVVLE